jgi:hypothetical protein
VVTPKTSESSGLSAGAPSASMNRRHTWPTAPRREPDLRTHREASHGGIGCACRARASSTRTPPATAGSVRALASNASRSFYPVTVRKRSGWRPGSAPGTDPGTVRRGCSPSRAMLPPTFFCWITGVGSTPCSSSMSSGSSKGLHQLRPARTHRPVETDDLALPHVFKTLSPRPGQCPVPRR